LLPSALQDWLPEGYLAYYISDGVDTLDPSAFHARYAGGGPRNQPFHPVSVDGTKIKAKASRHKAMSYERMQRAEAELKAPIDGLLARAKAADEAERNEPERSNNGSDAARLAPMLAAVQTTLGQAPQTVLADAGYRSEATSTDPLAHARNLGHPNTSPTLTQPSPASGRGGASSGATSPASGRG
jgi:hypothetical protein